MQGYDRYGDGRGTDDGRGDPFHDDQRDGRAQRPEGRRGSRREPDPLEQLDRWVSAGRQFVDGVSGARPGARAPQRGERRAGAPGFRPADLGRWVENRLDRLLEDDGDDWREPWQEATPSPPSRRRPLEAISRRGLGRTPQPPPGEAWPDDDSFSLPRWQRPAPAPRQGGDLPDAPPPPASPGRPLPRSSRRR